VQGCKQVGILRPIFTFQSLERCFIETLRVQQLRAVSAAPGLISRLTLRAGRSEFIGIYCLVLPTPRLSSGVLAG